MLTADCRPDTKCRRGAKCRQQTADWVQNADWGSKEFLRLVCDNMSSYNLPSARNYFSAVSFHDYLHYFQIFLGHFSMKIDRTIISNLHSLLTLRESWLVWCLYRFYQRNKSRCRCKREVTIEYLTRATFEKQLTAFTWSVLSSF